jgi:hypothetical protein
VASEREIVPLPLLPMVIPRLSPPVPSRSNGKLIVVLPFEFWVTLPGAGGETGRSE